jgi:uncharacterized protein YecT (DUF1311 family)
MNSTLLNTFLAIIFMVLPCLSLAKEAVVDPIDKEEEKCIGKNHTKKGMTDCAIQAEAAWDKEMNAVYSKLMKRLDEKSREALRKSQRQWLIYRDNERAFINVYYSSFEGTMFVPMRANDRTELVKERVLMLRGYLSTLDMK